MAMRNTKGRKTFIVMDVPELDFIPHHDREGVSSSPQGVLSNKIFKYKGEQTGRVLYSQVMDIYGIDALVIEKNQYLEPDGRSTEEIAYQRPEMKKPHKSQGRLF